MGSCQWDAYSRVFVDWPNYTVKRGSNKLNFLANNTIVQLLSGISGWKPGTTDVMNYVAPIQQVYHPNGRDNKLHQ